MDRHEGSSRPSGAAYRPRFPLVFFAGCGLLAAIALAAPPRAGAQEDAQDLAAEEPRPEPPGQAHEAFEILGSPSQFALRDLTRGATGASVAFSYMGDLTSDPDFTLRLAVGLQLGLIDDRLRIGLLFPVDLDHQSTQSATGEDIVPAFYRRGGGADVRASLGWMLVAEQDLQVLVDLAVWIPSGGQPHGIGWTRLAPSVDVQDRIGDRLIFRGRVGGIFDADGDGEQLGAVGLGLDYVVLGSWTLGAQLDGFGGRSGDLDGLGAGGDEGVIGVGAGIGSSVALLDWLCLEAGFRVALTDDYRDELGRYNFTVGVRAADERHAQR